MATGPAGSGCVTEGVIVAARSSESVISLDGAGGADAGVGAADGGAGVSLGAVSGVGCEDDSSRAATGALDCPGESAAPRLLSRRAAMLPNMRPSTAAATSLPSADRRAFLSTAY